MDSGYDQSKNWEVGRSDLSKTGRSEPPTSQFPRGRPLLAHNSETISQNHIKFGVSRVNILDYSVINFQVNRTYPSRVIVVGSWVRFCVDSLGAADLSVSERSERPTSQFLEGRTLRPLSFWKVGRSDLSKTGRSERSDLSVFERSERSDLSVFERSERPTSQFFRRSSLPSTDWLGHLKAYYKILEFKPCSNPFAAHSTA